MIDKRLTKEEKKKIKPVNQAGGPNYLLQFLNEKVISKNSVAFGGNTELLNLQEDL